MDFKFNHIGVPTTKVQENESYAEGMKVHLTSFDGHPFRFEYLRFEPGSPLAKEIQENVHIAVEVDSIDAVISDFDKVVLEKTDLGELFICFALKDMVVFELMEMK